MKVTEKETMVMKLKIILHKDYVLSVPDCERKVMQKYEIIFTGE